MGAHEKPIDWEKLDFYIFSQSPSEEVAEALGIDRKTLYNRLKEKYGMDFSTYSTKKRSEGIINLRAKQWQKALKEGNVTMLIKLGEYYIPEQKPQAQEAKPQNDDMNEAQHRIMQLEHIISELKLKLDGYNESKTE